MKLRRKGLRTERGFRFGEFGWGMMRGDREMRRNRFQDVERGRTAAGVLTLVVVLGLVASVGTSAEGDATPGTPGSLEFVGHNLFGDANGIFHSWRVVESRIDPESPEGTGSYAVIEVDLASLDTGIGRRDDHLRNPDFFEVETYPVARVRVHSPVAAGLSESGQPRYTAQFDIDLHGVEMTVEGEIRQIVEGPIGFEGSLIIDRTAFGIGDPPSRWNPMSVRAEVPVSFRIDL
jgi:polyisoprenoid-binding protein YceI